MRTPPPRTLGAGIALLALTAACSGSGSGSAAPVEMAPPRPLSSSTASSSSSTTDAMPPTTMPPTSMPRTTMPRSTSTTEAPAATTTAKPAPAELSRGSKGAPVQALEERLAGLKYDTGKVDGVFDEATGHAVMAFQKVNGLDRTGRAGASAIKALDEADDPPPLLAAGGASRVEVDIKRQALFVYKGSSLVRILSVSTGNDKRYCVDGECDVAVTPGGSFRVSRRIKGVRMSRLGELFNPVYFNGGIAVHGSPSVPAYPASHGCVRIPMSSSVWFYDNIPDGTPVYVIGGKRAAVPFDEPAPPASESAPPAPATTTTTQAPATTTTTTTTTQAPATTEAPTPTTATQAPPTTTATPAAP